MSKCMNPYTEKLKIWSSLKFYNNFTNEDNWEKLNDLTEETS